jgi:hypothetical protein
MSTAETALAAMRPTRTATPREWLAQYDRIDWGSSLNGYIGREILQAIDGTRTGLDIYRLALAEAREGGDYYYGIVRARGGAGIVAQRRAARVGEMTCHPSTRLRLARDDT